MVFTTVVEVEMVVGGDSDSVGGAVAAFPFASGVKVVYPPIGPVNVGLIVTKTTVIASVLGV
jgi:hypothetical protein